eukprot:m.177712 g.177712  ORF g.177712 m.177712 type:complete len:340 (+) comp17969_c1_seq1:143-1162(+)
MNTPKHRIFGQMGAVVAIIGAGVALASIFSGKPKAHRLEGLETKPGPLMGPAVKPPPHPPLLELLQREVGRGAKWKDFYHICLMGEQNVGKTTLTHFLRAVFTVLKTADDPQVNGLSPKDFQTRVMTVFRGSKRAAKGTPDGPTNGDDSRDPTPHLLLDNVIVWDIAGINTPKNPVADIIPRLELLKMSAIVILASRRNTDLEPLIPALKKAAVYWLLADPRASDLLRNDADDEKLSPRQIVENLDKRKPIFAEWYKVGEQDHDKIFFFNARAKFPGYPEEDTDAFDCFSYDLWEFVLAAMEMVMDNHPGGLENTRLMLREQRRDAAAELEELRSQQLR